MISTLTHLHIIYEHGEDLKPFSIAYIRDILPFTHTLNASVFQVTDSTSYSPADIIVAERGWKPGLNVQQAEQLVHQVHQDNASLIYTIDDNLLDLEYVSLPVRQAVIYFCRHADAILTSTEYLKNRLQHLNPHIFVLPNSLDEKLFTDNSQRLPVRRNTSSHLTIGFMGTYTHDADLMMVLQALRTVLRQHMDTVQLQIVGGVSDPGLIRLFQGLPVQVLHPDLNDVAYPNFIQWMKKNLAWDIGLAPLEDTPFNLCKSDIKFLDYSALGIPGIYSQVPSYESTIHHMENGYLVENTPAAWTEALELLLADIELRIRLAQNAQEYVFSQRTLQQCAHLWREAVLSIPKTGAV